MSDLRKILTNLFPQAASNLAQTEAQATQGNPRFFLWHLKASPGKNPKVILGEKEEGKF